MCCPSPVLTPNWKVTGRLVVGNALSGGLTITDGGSVANDDARIGNFNSGTVTVSGLSGSGASSSWISRGWAVIGTEAGSAGTVMILNGGVGHGDSATIGLNSGRVTVFGAGSA